MSRSDLAVAMARTSDLEQRIRSILDAAHNHLPLSRGGARSLALVSVLLLLALSASKLGLRSATTDSTAATLNSDETISQLSYSGRVVNEIGEPVQGAEVYRLFWSRGPEWNTAPVATTNSDGEFRVDVPFDDNTKSSGEIFAMIACAAPGYGLATVPSMALETTGVLNEYLGSLASYGGDLPIERVSEIRLPSDFPLLGRIIDIDGQPVASAHLQVEQMLTPSEPDDTLDTWEREAASGNQNFYTLRNKHHLRTLSGNLSDVVGSVTTGPDGSFRLKGIGPDRIVSLRLSGPGIEASTFDVRTRNGDTLFFKTQGPGSKSCYANNLRYAAGPGGKVIGQVTDAETGRPLAGIEVAAGTRSTRFGIGRHWLKVKTDADGRYALDGFTLNKSELVFVRPSHDSAYLPVGARINIRTAEEPVQRDFQLREGRWLHGKITDAVSGEPIAGAAHYYAFRNNANLKRYPDFARSMIDLEALTDDEGKFRIAVPAGKGIIGFKPFNSSLYRSASDFDSIELEPANVQGKSRIYSTVPNGLITSNEAVVQQVDVADSPQPTQVSLSTTAGKMVSVRIVDPSGNHVEGCSVNGIFEDHSSWIVLKKDTFHVQSVFSDTRRDVFAYNERRNLIGHLLVDSSADEAVLTLAPAGTVKGRLVDGDGAPVTLQFEGLGVAGNELETDADGSFELRGLIPGREYSIRSVPDRREVLSGMKVTGAMTLELGDVKMGKNVSQSLSKAIDSDPIDNETIQVDSGDAGPAHAGLWREGRPVGFAFVGLLDLDSDGIDDRRTIFQKLRKLGARIDAQLGPDGVQAGPGMTATTSFLVVGTDAELKESHHTNDHQSSELDLKYRAFIEEARLQGIIAINLERFAGMLNRIAAKQPS